MQLNTIQRKKARRGFEQAVGQEEIISRMYDILRVGKQGPMVLLWDRRTMHRRKEVKQFLVDLPRIHMEYVPVYPPDLNPVGGDLYSHRKFFSGDISPGLAEP